MNKLQIMFKSCWSWRRKYVENSYSSNLDTLALRSFKMKLMFGVPPLAKIILWWRQRLWRRGEGSAPCGHPDLHVSIGLSWNSCCSMWVSVITAQLPARAAEMFYLQMPTCLLPSVRPQMNIWEMLSSRKYNYQGQEALLLNFSRFLDVTQAVIIGYCWLQFLSESKF